MLHNGSQCLPHSHNTTLRDMFAKHLQLQRYKQGKRSMVPSKNNFKLYRFFVKISTKIYKAKYKCCMHHFLWWALKLKCWCFCFLLPVSGKKLSNNFPMYFVTKLRTTIWYLCKFISVTLSNQLKWCMISNQCCCCKPYNTHVCKIDKCSKCIVQPLKEHNAKKV